MGFDTIAVPSESSEYRSVFPGPLPQPWLRFTPPPEPPGFITGDWSVEYPEPREKSPDTFPARATINWRERHPLLPQRRGP